MVSEEERYEEKRRLSWEFDVEEEEFEEKGNEDFLIWAVGIRSYVPWPQYQTPD